LALIETIAPPIVAVIVTCDPGEWFEETLQAFASQDYPELSILVLDAASAVDPTPRVAAVLPGAFVRRLPVNRGFGAIANEALSMVEGASLLLLCHDDIAPDPDAIHILVEESFRSNAGIVAPKLVSWDDPTRLLHVGMAVDKGGAVVDRMEPGEIDHGQHDAVRDVFLAPGGCTLVRYDLFVELDGFDEEVFAMGEDLDLCWRAQILGARVVVAPGALVRHLEMLASGRRPLPAHLSAQPADGVVAPVEDGGPQVTLQSLQRRHELHAALKAYSPFHLVRVLPQIALLSLAEAVIARVAGHRDRASAVTQAWRWNLGQRRVLRVDRASVRAHRRLDDSTVRRLQLHGSARLNAYVRRAVTHGVQAANLGGSERDLDAAAAAADAAALEQDQTSPTEVTAGVDVGPAPSTRWLVWLAAALVVVVGTRQLFGPGLPVIGQFLPMPSWTTLMHRFVSGWQPSGVGTTDPTSPATGILGLGGMVLFGSMGLLDKIVVLGCIPVGAIGMARLTRPLGTGWARVTSTVIYLALPVAYDALATGHWDALVVYAAGPWVLHLLGQASRVAPYAFDPAGDDHHGADPPTGLGAGGPSAPRPLRPWRHSLLGSILALGLLDAFATSMAPPAALVTVVVASGLALGNLASQGSDGLRPAGRVLACALGSTGVAIVLLAPWSIAVLGGPARWQTLAGLPVASRTGAGWGELLRLAVGPIGNAALGWAFLVAAALPLLIGARYRLAWAVRAWSIAVVAWVFAWLAGRGDLGALAVAPQVLLCVAGMAIALAVGLGVAAFQLDLPGYRFGWRQVAAVTAAAAAVVGMLPTLAGSLGGRWDLAPSGYAQATTWMSAPGAQGDFRVVWLGDPRVLPGNGWALSPGLTYVVSENGLPDITGLWPGSSPGQAAAIGNGIRLARRHATVRLGRLLAPYAVRYVVVVDTLAPAIPGLQNPIAHPAPDDVAGALAAQLDLRQVISQGGFAVFEDTGALPLRAVRSNPVATPSPAASVTGPAPHLRGWQPALPGAPGSSTVTGPVPAGTVTAAVAPSTRWQLTGPRGAVQHALRSPGYPATFSVAHPGTVTVSFDGSAAHAIEVAAEIAAWVAVVVALAGPGRWFDRWGASFGRARRRRRDVAGTSTVAVEEVPGRDPKAPDPVRQPVP
jgi:GT2 family glycosyltransferase